MKIQMKIKFLIPLLLLAFQLKAEVSLPQFFNNNMVLQRNQEVKIWGWAAANEKVSISFNGQTKKTKASKDGKWQIVLKPMKESALPLEMRIVGENKIVLNNILIGDVWIPGGQSNMEWSVANSNNSIQEIEQAKYPNIRLISVPRHIAFKPSKDIQPAKWKTAEGNNISYFSAVGYFFGRHIHENHHIPIGLINCNWGGTRAETWTSAEKLSPFGYTLKPIEQMKNSKRGFDEFVSKGQVGVAQWIDNHYPKNDRGDQDKWFENSFDFSDWKSINIPSEIEEEGLEKFDGMVWLKKTFTLPSNLANKNLFLRLGQINHMDVVYINGNKVFENYDASRWRSYPVSSGILNETGKNIITIKLFNPYGDDGLVEINKNKIAISPIQWNITTYDVPLAGEWKYKVSNTLEKPILAALPKPKKFKPDDFPSSLFNGMLHPLIPMSIKGAIWYQGQSNTKSFEDAILYEEVFPNMINDWRDRWGYDFEFYFVQLANYSRRTAACDAPCEQSWVYLRESQLQTLKLPNTGMAVIIDAGNPNDIHPCDKQTVGKRLGLIADAKAYGKDDVVYSGPLYKSYQVNGNKIHLTFNHIGKGLIAKSKYRYLRGFQIAGADKVFYWAKAQIENSQVLVFSEKVNKPVAVRYVWENNPEDANLYNMADLPASPFRTDDWKLYENE